MAYCSKCGAELKEGEAYCASCGTPVGSAVRSDAGSNDKLMGILCYLGILSLIPYFSSGQSSFVRFHALQGINLFILELIAGVAVSIVAIPLPGFGSLLGWLVSVAGLALSIIGIVRIVNGDEKELPFVGGIRIIKG